MIQKGKDERRNHHDSDEFDVIFFFFMREKKTFRSVFSNRRKFPQKIPTVVQVPPQRFLNPLSIN